MIRKYFILTLMLSCAVCVFALTDLGDTEVWTVSGKRTEESALDSSAVVFTVDAQNIERNHYESVSDAISSVGAATINSIGTIGSLQNANVNGMGSSRTLVYVDGALVSTSFDNSFDLNSIPISAIDKIEIITSGLAAGGIINIFTKKPTDSGSFEITFENGSYLPAAKGIGALADSQDLHFNYTEVINGRNVLVSIGAMRAANNYSYKSESHGINKWTQMENADTWASDAMVNVSGKIADTIQYTSNNLVRYQHLGVPGSITYKTEKDYQNNLLVNTVQTLSKDNFAISLNYTYNPVLVYYSDFDRTKSTHHKHNLSAKAQYSCEINESINITPYAETALEIAESTSMDKTQLRFYPKAGFKSSISFENLAFYPIADIGYTTDMKKWFANASIGTDYAIMKNINITGNILFSHRLPTFSDLYTPYKDYGYMTYQGNKNLKPEKALSADIGIVYDNGTVNATFDYFTRWVNDLILTKEDYSTMMNLDDALYMGFNLNSEITIGKLTAAIGWLYNRSYNLTKRLSMDDDKRIDNVRLNTLTFSASYRIGKISITTDGKYLGKYENSNIEYDGAFIWNIGLDFDASDKLKTYMKIDNILNSQYQLSYGYPMPGMKVRIGGAWSIK